MLIFFLSLFSISRCPVSATQEKEKGKIDAHLFFFSLSPFFIWSSRSFKGLGTTSHLLYSLASFERSSRLVGRTRTRFELIELLSRSRARGVVGRRPLIYGANWLTIYTYAFIRHCQPAQTTATQLDSGVSHPRASGSIEQIFHLFPSNTSTKLYKFCSLKDFV